MRQSRQTIYDVALLAEGVDRNTVRNVEGGELGAASPSSRRAWIEIFSGLYSLINGLVALLAEGVDRNAA